MFFTGTSTHSRDSQYKPTAVDHMHIPHWKEQPLVYGMSEHLQISSSQRMETDDPKPLDWLRPLIISDNSRADRKKEDGPAVSSTTTTAAAAAAAHALQQSIYQQYQLHQHASRRLIHHTQSTGPGVHISAGEKLGHELDHLCELLHHT